MQYTISGIVIRGDGYGKKLGFPTANLATRSPSKIKSGVYAGKADLGGEKYRAGIVVGPEGKVEAHLIGFTKDIYGEVLDLKLEKFLREYKNFDTEEELINQIKKDIDLCSKI